MGFLVLVFVWSLISVFMFLLNYNILGMYIDWNYLIFSLL